MIELLLQQFGGRGGSSGGRGGGGGGGGGSGSSSSSSDSWHNSSLNKGLRDIEDRIRKDKTESLYLLDEDGNVIYDKADGHKSQVNIPYNVYSLFRNNIITHNHPNGYMLSEEDLDSFITLNAREIRATTPDGRAFALRRTGDSQKRGLRAAYSREIKAAAQTVVPKHWDYGKSRTENIHNINVEMTKVVNKWLTNNAGKYGYEFREEKKRK